MEKNKEIKAVEMVRKIRDEHADQIRDMSPAERLAHYREEGARAHKKLRQQSSKVQKEK
jgi:hypothetical protein